MCQLQYLIFDVDGTLADTERDGHRIAFNRAFARAGLDWDWNVSLYGELLQVTGGKERILNFIQRFRPSLPKGGDSSDFIAELHRLKTTEYLKMVASGLIPLRPGVERLMNEARRSGLRLAIATTTTLENVTGLLSSTLGPKSLTWFEVIGAGDVVAQKKPAPDIYLYVLERLGVDPEQCLALEDSQHGLHAARGAGLRTVVTVNGYTQDQDLKGALLVVDHLGEPQIPCRVLRGDLRGKQYLDVTLLRELCGESKACKKDL